METLTKLLTGSKQFLVGFSLFWEKMGPHLGENRYKCCRNTSNPSLTHITSHMHWIMTHIDHRNTNKAIYCF
ncbi:hypothetical protein AtEden1_Chr4g0279851 [Arabidopsis thaliana]